MLFATHNKPRPLVMGLLNLTPDSFSDGGRFMGRDAALTQARKLIADGADVLDLGAESTRPGAVPISEQEELDRLMPVVEALVFETDTPLSIDTMKPRVAAAALAAGASLWNDVSALGWSADSPAMAARLACPVVLMHMQGVPASMQSAPCYDDVVADVAAFLMARAEAATAAGVAREALWLDPGIGFGKTLEHNLALLRGLEALTALGFPVLLGASRKRFIAGVDPSASDPMARLGGSLAAALRGAQAGCAAVRVHDVRETVQALDVWAAMRRPA